MNPGNIPVSENRGLEADVRFLKHMRELMFEHYVGKMLQQNTYQRPEHVEPKDKSLALEKLLCLLSPACENGPSCSREKHLRIARRVTECVMYLDFTVHWETLQSRMTSYDAMRMSQTEKSVLEEADEETCPPEVRELIYGLLDWKNRALRRDDE